MERLSALQERLYAESEGSVLIVVQVMDGGGKDSTIRRVFWGINPQGCYVVNFNAPTPEELEESNEVASHHLQHAGYLKVDIVGRDNARQGSRDNKALADRDLNS